MTIPMLSKHARDIGASPTVAGLIGSLYGCLQLFSCPLVGRWSDVSGRRNVLAWCLLFSAIGYAMLGLAGSVIMLMLARIPAGVFKHSQELSKSYLADITPTYQHSCIFGQFNSVSNIGFIIGPIVAGYVADNFGGFSCVAMLTSSVFMLNLVLVYFVPVEKVSKRVETVDDTPQLNVSLWRNIWDIMLVRFLLGTAVLVYRSDFVVTVSRLYAASNTVTGYITSLSTIIGTLTGFALGPINDYYCGSSWRMFLHSSIVQFVAFAAIVFSPNLVVLTVFQAMLSASCAVGRVTATDLTLSRGGRQFTGALIGAGATVLSVSRMLAPTISGFSHEFHDSGPVVVACALTAAGTLLLMHTSTHAIKPHTL